MRRAILACALLCGVSGHAFAVSCDGFVQTMGDAGRNPPVHAYVWRDGATWNVHYTLRNGQTVDRSTQYQMHDHTDANQTGWAGWSLRNANLGMIGKFMVGTQDHHIYYDEWLVDAQNRTLASNYIDCGPDPNYSAPPQPPAYVAPPVAPPPAPTPTFKPTIDSVPAIIVDRTAHVNIMLGSQGVTVLIDTGASNMSVPADLADRLIAAGEATEGPATHVSHADGATVDARSIIINTIKIGTHTLNNIRSVVEPTGSEPLLGFYVLNQVSGKFAINTRTNTLDFE